MEKINKCPMCGIPQLIKYSDDIILPIEECFDTLHASALAYDGLKAKESLFNELTSFIDKQARAEMSSLEFEYKVITELAPILTKAKKINEN